MFTQRRLLIGSLLVFFGILLLVGEIFDLEVGKICWPAGLILLGVFLIARPGMFGPASAAKLRPFANIRRAGIWQPASEEIWMLVGDVRLDLTQAMLPPGETVVTIYGFVGDIHLTVPAGVGLAVASTAFLTTGRIFGQKGDHFLTTLERANPEYAQAERKVRLETIFFVADLKVETGSA